MSRKGKESPKRSSELVGGTAKGLDFDLLVKLALAQTHQAQAEIAPPPKPVFEVPVIRMGDSSPPELVTTGGHARSSNKDSDRSSKPDKTKKRRVQQQKTVSTNENAGRAAWDMAKRHPKWTAALTAGLILTAWGAHEARGPAPPGPVWTTHAELPDASDPTKPKVLGALTLTVLAAHYSDITLADNSVVPGIGFQIGIAEIDPDKYRQIMQKDPADPTGATLLVPQETYTIDTFFNGLSNAGQKIDPIYKEYCEQEVWTGVESGKQRGDEWSIETLSGGKVTSEQLKQINNIYDLPPFGSGEFNSEVPVIGYAYTTDPAQKIICEPASQ